jgi:hypothetical protein
MPTWTPRARLRPAFSASRLILLILFWLWGLGGILGAIAILRWTNGSTPAEGVGASEFEPFKEFGAVIWLGGLILLGLSALMCGKYWFEEER